MIVSRERRPTEPRLDETGRVVLLEAKGLSFRYQGGGECALEGVDLTLCEGERVALIGASGTGKTTLLRALEGSLKPAIGEVERNGKAVLVYQDQRLVAEQSVLANVCMGALGELSPWRGAFGFPREIRLRAEELLRDLGLERLAERKVSSLSGGQRQRVAIARALCSRPKVLLADEPLASLDGRNAVRALQLLTRLQEKYGFALLVSVHQLGPAVSFFDRFVMMHNRCLHACDAEACQTCPIARSDLAQEEPALDPNLDRDRGKLRIAGLALAGLGFLMLLTWAAQALNLGGGAFGGALGGLFGFLGGIVPGSLREVLDLPWAQLSGSLLQTVQMAILGTTVGLALSLPMSVFASRQTSPAVLRVPMRFFLNVIRTVPSIFWALLFVAFLGLGPVAGVFALAAYSTGYLTKFFYEGLEDTDERPVTALRAIGASRLQTFFRAVLPAARPALIGSCLFVFEYNIRAASVLGVVGAGGIGQDLMYYIEWRRFPEAAAGLVLLLVLVVALDAVSQSWRKRLNRQRGV
jgi:phosphonate transport system permease protein